MSSQSKTVLTTGEANALLDAEAFSHNDNYHWFHHSGEVELDGNFTSKDLEVILKVVKLTEEGGHNEGNIQI